jgi:hypothetical protein
MDRDVFDLLSPRTATGQYTHIWNTGIIHSAKNRHGTVMKRAYVLGMIEWDRGMFKIMSPCATRCHPGQVFLDAPRRVIGRQVGVVKSCIFSFTRDPRTGSISIMIIMESSSYKVLKVKRDSKRWGK